MATHFLPEEVINAPAWILLCLFPSSNDCLTAVMTCKRETENHADFSAENSTDDIRASSNGNRKKELIHVGVSQKHPAVLTPKY